MLSRAKLYLIRKRGKTFTLFILISLISTFVTISLSLMHTTNEVSAFMRTTLGAQIEIRQHRQLVLHGQDSVPDVDAPLTSTILKEIMGIQGITQYNTRNNGFVSGLSFVQGFHSSGYDDMGGIQGVNDTGLLSNFSNQTLTLDAGRHITTDDENVVIISETLALANELTIGDMIELAPAALGTDEAGRFVNTVNYSGSSTQAKVIGIFVQNEMRADESLQPTAGLVVNQLFSDHTLMTNLGLANPDEYEEATFYVENPADLPEIMGEIEQVEGLGEEIFLIQPNDFNYMRISGDLQTMQSLILILLIGIGLVSTIILVLILVLRMRGRIREVGILLSVGIRKSQIWGSFLLEIAMVALAAFMFSYATSSLIVPFLKQGILADLPVMYDLGQYGFQPMPLPIYSVVYLSILLVILLVAFISTLLTIRLKPKQILSKMS